jgi:uncharacterized protein with ParB-like and HNH nuclease domain
MDSRPFTVQQIYQDRRQYRVPFYQRPYVWNLDDQWGRLWDDIREKAEARLQGGKTFPHFMGAVVLEPQKKAGLLGVERHHIIDGQQRLTTLQYVLTALAHTLRVTKNEKLLPLIEACLTNSNPETMEDVAVERYKLWPTFRDRKQYEEAMTATSLDELRQRFAASFTQAGNLRKIGMDHPPALEAIMFFHEQMMEWVKSDKEVGSSACTAALTSAILTDLSIVCISLGEDDDAQVIFETLNGHGAELHATDLIRNFIFMRAGSDSDDLYNNLWSQFEAPIWSEKQTRGRLSRPRLEWFVQTAVQAQTGDEIDIGRLYAGYRRFVDGDAGLNAAAAQLAMLNRFAEYYRALATGQGPEPIAVFGRRIAVWDASPTHALALRVATSSLSAADQQEIYSCIESYLVRRAVCGLSRKSYNKVFAAQLKRLIEGTLTTAEFRNAFRSLSGDASRWPSDEEFKHSWIHGAIYPGRLDAPKLRTIFHRLETAMRSEKTEEVVPMNLESLDIDHVMPKSWYRHWPLSDGTTVSEFDASNTQSLRYSNSITDPRIQAIVDREDAVPKIGNLTIVHLGVNRAIQNNGMDEKRKALFEHSNLQLNRALTQCESWDEAAIAARGEVLFNFAVKIWPGLNLP